MKTIKDITHSYAEALDAEKFNVLNEEDEWVNNEVNTDALQNEENWEDEADVRMIYNDAQMLNGSIEGDTISQKGKKILEKRKNKKKYRGQGK